MVWGAVQKVLSEQEWKREAMEIEMLEEEGDFETRYAPPPAMGWGWGWGWAGGMGSERCMTLK